MNNTTNYFITFTFEPSLNNDQIKRSLLRFIKSIHNKLNEKQPFFFISCPESKTRFGNERIKGHAHGVLMSNSLLTKDFLTSIWLKDNINETITIEDIRTTTVKAINYCLKNSVDSEDDVVIWKSKCYNADSIIKQIRWNNK